MHAAVLLLMLQAALGAAPTPGPTPSAPVIVTAPSASASSPAPTAADDVMVCRYEPEVGSRISKRTCRTKGEWTRIEGYAQDEMKRFNGRGATCPPGATC